MTVARADYNYIYKELVADESDILGKLAYSLYKRQKIEYIQTFKEKHGNDPTDADLMAFHDVSNNASQLDGYRNQAEQLALSFLETSLANEAKELEELYSAKADNEIRSFRPRFWVGVSQSVVGSACFILLLGCLVFFTWSLKQGPRQVIEQVFGVAIVDRPATETTAEAALPQQPAAPEKDTT
ncbi:hypothetical protein ABQX22_12565 [Xanthomonas sp. WHRI 1810A]|uniref:hypothetical protein n=1 Tax=Xanthomonas sp. WHRI 1810A TaxID=3161565 RepID=UPI0032E9343A